LTAVKEGKSAEIVAVFLCKTQIIACRQTNVDAAAVVVGIFC